MANRFQQITAPISYEGVQMYSPNFEVLNASLANLQQRFDTAKAASNKSFQALGMDAADRTRVLEEQQTRMSEIADVYSQDLTKGNQAVDQFISDIQRNYSPGGEAYEINKQVGLYQAYADQVDEMFKSGVITNAEKVGWLKSASLNRFGGTNYDPQTGQYNTFAGVDPTRDVDLTSMAIKIGEGWEETALATPVMNADGTPKLDSNGDPIMEYNPDDWTRGPNGYYRVSDYKVVSFDEIFQHVSKAMNNDPTAIAYLKQEADMLGLQDPALINAFMQKKITDAAALISEKESRLIAKNTYLKDWQASDRISHLRELERLKYEYSLNNLTTTVTDVTEGVRLMPTGGLSESSVNGLKENAVRRLTTSAGILNDLGIGKYINAYNSDKEPEDKLTLETPEDYERLYEAWQAGELQPYIQNDPNKQIDVSMYSRQFNLMEQAIRDRRTAEARLETGENMFRSTLSADQLQVYDSYDQVMTSNIRNIKEKFPDLELSEHEIRSLIETNRPIVKNGLYYEMTDKTIFVQPGKVRKDGTPIPVDGPLNNYNNYGSDLIAETRQVVSDLTDLTEKKSNVMGEYLSHTPEVDIVSSDYYDPSAPPEQIQKEREAVNEYFEDPVKQVRAISLAKNLSDDQKELMIDRIRSGKATLSGNRITHGAALDGNTHWVLSYVDSESPQAGEDGMLWGLFGKDPDNRTAEIYVEASAQNGLTIPSLEHVNQSEQAKVGRIYSNIRSSSIGVPYTDPAIPDVTFMSDDKGNIIIGDRTFTKDRGLDVVTGLLTTQDRLRRAGINYNTYRERILPTLQAVQDAGGSINAMLATTNLSADQLSIVLYGEPNRIKSTDQPLRVDPTNLYYGGYK